MAGNLLAEMGDPSRKDVVLAILGASAALGGFVLVFLGQLIAAYKEYPADSAKSVRESRRNAAWPVLGVFVLSVATIAVALVWLAVPGGTCFYRFAVGVFIAELTAIVAVAVYTTTRLLR